MYPYARVKGEMKECANYRGISLLSILGKIYESKIIGGMIASMERQMGDEEGGFGRGMGCRCHQVPG